MSSHAVGNCSVARMLESEQRLLPEARYNSAWRISNVESGNLPERYLQPWAARFDELLAPWLRPGMAVLDVGSGREPVLASQRRPRLTYVGLDISRAELELAPPGAYDSVEIANITDHIPGLRRQFDVVLSYQVLEHVAPLASAIENIADYLKPGGVFIAVFSGRYSPMAIINRLIPHLLAKPVNQVLLGRPPDSMFQVHYDRCHASAIRAMLADWEWVDIEPRWEAANYFTFLKPVLKTYLAVENLLARGGWEDLATHYFLTAQR